MSKQTYTQIVHLFRTFNCSLPAYIPYMLEKIEAQRDAGNLSIMEEYALWEKLLEHAWIGRYNENDLPEDSLLLKAIQDGITACENEAELKDNPYRTRETILYYLAWKAGWFFQRQYEENMFWEDWNDYQESLEEK